jgi:hypothetical protein
MRAAACTVILSAWSFGSAFAQSEGTQPQAQPPAQFQGQARQAGAPAGQANGKPVEQAGFHAGVITHLPGPVPSPNYLPPYAPNIMPCQYPSLNAPLYPCPVPNVPYQCGATLITNQAFDPHEMLYPHTYRSIYPPYYYEVHGGWKLFPWGVVQREQWRLRGTVVTVKYDSSIGLFSGFVPPALNTLNVVRPHGWDATNRY